MIRSIKKLDKSVSNKIAAGEVVERPSSVVKELLENSIDAGSTQIVIEIKDAGKELIRISDNGHGINKDEIELAFERHATSKIYTDEDIYDIKSLGFRGEALASISSVSKVELITRQKNTSHGIKAELLQGAIMNSSSIGCQVGTTIVIKDLLYNTPARRKFLKSNATELNHINNIVNNIALSHPNIGFKYIVNDRHVFNTKGDENIINCIYTIYGKDIARNLMPIDVEYNGLKLSGFVSKIKNTRGNRQLETTFVNNRYVKSRVFSMSIEEAYKTLIPKGRFPICFLYLMVPTKEIDVNIHPAKTEIKFRDELKIRSFIIESVSDVLLSNNIIPAITINEKPVVEPSKKSVLDISNISLSDITTQKDNSIPKETIKTFNSKPFIKDTTIEPAVKKTFDTATKKDMPILGDQFDKQISLALSSRSNDMLKDSITISEEDIKAIDTVNESIQNFETNHKEYDESLFKTSKFEKSPANIGSQKEKKVHVLLDELRIIGQIFKTYIICEANGQMYLIDQHAAHERILYERFLKSFKEEEIISQILLDPISIDLNYQDKKLIMDNKVIFRKLGYKIEDFGYNTIILREVPILFKAPMAKSFFMDILDKVDSISTSYDMRIEKIISMSCKEAIKAMDRLEIIEIDSLLKDLKTIDNPFTCPHGRPTIISISKKELEKKFFRT